MRFSFIGGGCVLALAFGLACSSNEESGAQAGAGGTAGSGGDNGGAGGSSTGGASGQAGASGGAAGGGGMAGGVGGGGVGGGGVGGGGVGGGGVDGGAGVGGSSTWPAPSPCDEGTASPVCQDGVAEDGCPDQVTFFSQTAQDEAGGYWGITKPKGGFRLAQKYAAGNAYLRLEVTQKPTDIEVFPQLCAWRWDPQAQCPDRWKTFAETCSSSSALAYTSNGVYYVALGAPEGWWQKAPPLDWSYSLPFDAMRIMHKAEHNGSKYLLKDSACGTACWPVAGEAAQHLPIEMHGELVLVAQGATFQTPPGWASCAENWCN